MGQLSEQQKEILAVILALGLLYVFAKVAYEYFLKERFSIYNVLHPVRRISTRERHFISSFLVPFTQFSPKQRKQFLKRFAWFKSKKPFVFYGTIENKEEIKAYVSASAILLTMGMEDFRYEKSISRIIVYPNQYYSKIGKSHHIGEYNPNLKILVFSAEDLIKGYEISNDNRNLGIHEIAHALMFETRKKSSWEARKFKVGLTKIKQIYDMPEFQERLEHSDYFRAYVNANFYEFFAVILENFVETPKEFKVEFPGIFDTLKRMLNIDYSNLS